MTIVINLIGGPGVGKSLIAGLLFSELKILNYSVEYIQEYVKFLIWSNHIDKIHNQYQVVQKQYQLLKNIDGQVNFIVTDGSLLHNLYYNKADNENVSNIEKTELFAKKCLGEFNNIFILLDRGNYKFEQVGRIHTEEESIKIDKELKKILDELNIEYITITSDKNNISKMIDYIISKKFE